MFHESRPKKNWTRLGMVGKNPCRPEWGIDVGRRGRWEKNRRVCGGSRRRCDSRVGPDRVDTRRVL